MPKELLEKRFWKYVEPIMDDRGCWEWAGSRRDIGYDAIGSGPGYPGPKMLQAHRLSWEIHNGPVPPRVQVLHRCDNPPCVNPNHLFLGTQRDNVLDCLAKGRRGAGQLKRNNTSGFPNVYRARTGWRVVIRRKGKYIRLGHFETRRKAAEAVQQWRGQ
jgi:hypothetical protein